MNRSDYCSVAPKGQVNRGSRQKILHCMKKAEVGLPVTVGFLGGSITQGSLASSPETCYAYLVYEWWKQKFPQSDITYINAGVGGTTSQFGAARVREDLLSEKPDFAVVEFSVNDDPTDFFEETYEGLIRTLVMEKEGPAVLLLHNVRYDNGISAEDRHLKIGRVYGLPCVSMRESLFPLISAGKVLPSELSPDGLHPNDYGHRLVADTVIACLEDIYRNRDKKEEPWPMTPVPLTANRFQQSVRLQNGNSYPMCSGFTVDPRAQNGVSDFFKRGWTASEAGAWIRFEFEGTGAAIQFRRSIRHPAPVAEAVVDGDEAHAVLLDGNFDETWGDCLALVTAAQNLVPGKHCVEVRVIRAEPGLASDFYLVSVISNR